MSFCGSFSWGSDGPSVCLAYSLLFLIPSLTFITFAGTQLYALHARGKDHIRQPLSVNNDIKEVCIVAAQGFILLVGVLPWVSFVFMVEGSDGNGTGIGAVSLCLWSIAWFLSFALTRIELKTLFAPSLLTVLFWATGLIVFAILLASRDTASSSEDWEKRAVLIHILCLVFCASLLSFVAMRQLNLLEEYVRLKGIITSYYNQTEVLTDDQRRQATGLGSLKPLCLHPLLRGQSDKSSNDSLNSALISQDIRDSGSSAAWGWQSLKGVQESWDASGELPQSSGDVIFFHSDSEPARSSSQCLPFTGCVSDEAPAPPPPMPLPRAMDSDRESSILSGSIDRDEETYSRLSELSYQSEAVGRKLSLSTTPPAFTQRTVSAGHSRGSTMPLVMASLHRFKLENGPNGEPSVMFEVKVRSEQTSAFSVDRDKRESWTVWRSPDQFMELHRTICGKFGKAATSRLTRPRLRSLGTSGGRRSGGVRDSDMQLDQRELTTYIRTVVNSRLFECSELEDFLAIPENMGTHRIERGNRDEAEDEDDDLTDFKNRDVIARLGIRLRRGLPLTTFVFRLRTIQGVVSGEGILSWFQRHLRFTTEQAVQAANALMKYKLLKVSLTGKDYIQHRQRRGTSAATAARRRKSTIPLKAPTTFEFTPGWLYRYSGKDAYKVLLGMKFRVTSFTDPETAAEVVDWQSVDSNQFPGPFFGGDPDEEQEETSSSHFITFVIHVRTSKERWEIRRRYSEFDYLNRQFIKLGIQHKFPRKSRIHMKKSTAQLDTRRKELGEYLVEVVRTVCEHNQRLLEEGTVERDEEAIPGRLLQSFLDHDSDNMLVFHDKDPFGKMPKGSEEEESEEEEQDEEEDLDAITATGDLLAKRAQDVQY